jgi:hypothetical protein
MNRGQMQSLSRSCSSLFLWISSEFNWSRKNKQLRTCNAVNFSGCFIIVSLRDRLRFGKVKRQPAVTRAAGCIRDALRILKDARNQYVEEKLLILAKVAIVILWCDTSDNGQLEVFKLISTGPQGKRSCKRQSLVGDAREEYVR